MIDDPQMDFYSSDDNSSDSEDDPRPFKLEKPSLNSALHKWEAKNRGSYHSSMHCGLPYHYGTHWKTLQSLN